MTSHMKTDSYIVYKPFVSNNNKNAWLLTSDMPDYNIRYLLEEMIHGLGSRSARHVMNRADMLILEVMIHLTEQYRNRYLRRVHPPRQLPLPGFDAA